MQGPHSYAACVRRGLHCRQMSYASIGLLLARLLNWPVQSPAERGIGALCFLSLVVSATLLSLVCMILLYMYIISDTCLKAYMHSSALCGGAGCSFEFGSAHDGLKYHIVSCLYYRVLCTTVYMYWMYLHHDACRMYVECTLLLLPLLFFRTKEGRRLFVFVLGHARAGEEEPFSVLHSHAFRSR